jgi:hypothetical protein
MPKPTQKELRNGKKEQYISRCMKKVRKEGKGKKQAAGQCYGMWRSAKKKRKK